MMKLKMNTLALSILLFTNVPTYTLAFNTEPASTSSDSDSHFIGYWQNYRNSATLPVRLTDIPDGFDIVTIAFASVNPNGNVKFTLQGPPYKDTADGLPRFKEDIKSLQNNGVKVLLSLGGMNSFFHVDNPKKATNFLTSLEKIITEYGFDGVDYDLEGDLNRKNTIYLLEVTRTLKSDFEKKDAPLFLTVAPQSIDVNWQVSQGKYDPLINEGLVDAVSVQLYNSTCKRSFKSGSPCYAPGTQDFIVSQADSTIQAWKKRGVKQPESLYVIGLAATNYGTNSGYARPEIVKKALSCLKTGKECATYTPTKTYPQLGGLMSWNINWDAKNKYSFVNALSE